MSPLDTYQGCWARSPNTPNKCPRARSPTHWREEAQATCWHPGLTSQILGLEQGAEPSLTVSTRALDPRRPHVSTATPPRECPREAALPNAGGQPSGTCQDHPRLAQEAEPTAPRGTCPSEKQGPRCGLCMAALAPCGVPPGAPSIPSGTPSATRWSEASWALHSHGLDVAFMPATHDSTCSA